VFGLNGLNPHGHVSPSAAEIVKVVVELEEASEAGAGAADATPGIAVPNSPVAVKAAAVSNDRLVFIKLPL
jgi:hypothetical protein